MIFSKIFMQDENKGCLDLQNLDPPLLEVLSCDANQSVYTVSIRWDLVKVYDMNVKGTRYMYMANFLMLKFWKYFTSYDKLHKDISGYKTYYKNEMSPFLHLWIRKNTTDMHTYI